MTWLDLVRSSLRLIGQLGPGRSVTTSSSEVVDAQFVLNALLDSLNADRLNIDTISAASYNLVAGTQSYTIGSGGTFSATRPQKIEQANIILTGGTIRVPLTLINDEQWAAIRLQSVQSSIPQLLYNDGAYPLSTLYLWPIPSAAQQIELYTWGLLSQVSDLSTTVSLAPGQADMIRYQLAVRMAAEWNKPLRPDVAEMAGRTLANFQRSNLPAPVMQCDGAVLGGSNRGSFNWLTGEIGR